MIDGTLKPYLTYSAAGHAALGLLAALAAAGRTFTAPQQTYRIDFIGAAPGIINRDAEAGGGAPAKAAAAHSPAPAARPAPQKDPDAFNLRKHRAPLPKPSLLGGEAPAPAVSAPAEEKAAEPAASAPAEASAPSAAPGPGGPGTGASASVSADMPDFPYPWYLARLRAALWDRWSARMPDSVAECAVSFSILRDGRSTDLRVDSTSGDSAFDYAALSAVKDSAPFAPLPQGFPDPFLKVHVQFKR